MCVKPGDAGAVMAELVSAGLRAETLVISILAGVSTGQLEAMLGTANPVVRAMPNTPATVGEGMTVVCGGKQASNRDIARAQRIFEAVGKCLALDEKHFDAVTALSGSGPGYLYLIMEALSDAGVRVGLPPDGWGVDAGGADGARRGDDGAFHETSSGSATGRRDDAGGMHDRRHPGAGGRQGPFRSGARGGGGDEDRGSPGVAEALRAKCPRSLYSPGP